MRIGSQLSGADLAARHHLMQAFAGSQRANTRLATMIRINRAADDPAGLIAMEQLQAELTAIRAASDNAARAGGVVHVAEAALGEVGDLLNSIRGHVVQAAGGGLSDAEIAAKQIEVDAALEAIDRIGSYTSFNGQKLLDGDSLTFNFSPDPADPVTLDMPNVNTSALGGGGGRLSDLASSSPRRSRQSVQYFNARRLRSAGSGCGRRPRDEHADCIHGTPRYAEQSHGRFSEAGGGSIPGPEATANPCAQPRRSSDVDRT